ncbi:carbohydrate ABC transporter permease [Bacillota bacterium Meth-B3]|nr:carbohydrate ABC transporter permease [Christensenellaceae bacterium]
MMTRMSERTRSAMGHRRRWSLIAMYACAAVLVLWSVTPIIWMALSSLKVSTNMFSMPPQFIFKPELGTYVYMFTQAGFGKFLVNSLVASLSSTLIALFLGSLGGYALSRGRFKHHKDISFWIISTRMAPIPAVILPLYLIFSRLRMVGTMPGLIFAYITFNLPFALWMMMAFFADVPAALEEAARVDGTSKFGAFLRITLPAASPGLAATGVLCMMFAWNDYVFASALTSAHTQTVPIAASLLVTQTGIAWGQAMSTGTIIVMPMLLCGFLMRKYLVKGFSMGAVK